jgi:parallel beta-helix repeat protein
MPSLSTVWSVVAVAALTVAALAGTATAAPCGEGVPCGCGDTVTRSAMLTADLGPCPGTGLVVARGASLDCAGHMITGSDGPAARYGVLLDMAAGARVMHCRITGFRRGIRLFGGHKNQVTRNEVFANHDYGIELAGGSRRNRIASNLVRANRDEGIHVGAGAHDNEVLDNTVTDNKHENIYVLSSNGCRIVRNTSTRTEGAAIFLKHSSETYVADNTVVNGPIHVRGDSARNTFVNNSLRGNGYFFEAYEEPPGFWTHPRGNVVIGGQVENTRTCLRFAGAFDNAVDGLALDDECELTMWPLGGQEPTGNVVHTVPLP